MVEKNELDRSMQRYYENRAVEYDEWYNRVGRYNEPRTNAAWHAQVAELGREAARFGGMLARAPRLRALDLACGTGKWTPFFVHGLQDSGRLVAYDYSPAMLEQTRLRLEEDNPINLEKTLFVRGDAYGLPFPAQTFDFVFFGFWLSHVPDERLAAFLGEVRRVMRPGGNVLIFDSARVTGKPEQEIARRPLNDGSVYEVLKSWFSPARLQAVLEPVFPGVSVRQTRDFFVMAQATI